MSKITKRRLTFGLYEPYIFQNLRIFCMKNTFLTLTTLLCIISSGVFAQPYVDLLNLRYYALPTQVNENQKTTVTWTQATMDLPIQMKQDYLVVSPFYECYKFDQTSVKIFRDHTLAKVQDIEELTLLGKSLHSCPYYGTRESILSAEVNYL